MEIVYEKVENILKKVNASYQHLLLFHNVLKKFSFR